MAMAAASHKLNVPLSLFVPTSTPQIIHEKLKARHKAAHFTFPGLVKLSK